MIFAHDFFDPIFLSSTVSADGRKSILSSFGMGGKLIFIYWRTAGAATRCLIVDSQLSLWVLSPCHPLDIFSIFRFFYFLFFNYPPPYQPVSDNLFGHRLEWEVNQFYIGRQLEPFPYIRSWIHGRICRICHLTIFWTIFGFSIIC